MDSQFAQDSGSLQPQVSPFKTALTYGLYMGLGLMAFSLIMYMLAIPLDSKLHYVQYLIYFVVIWFGIKHHRDQDLGGYISYGRGLGCGTLIAGVAGIIMGIYTFILFKYIDPDLVNQIFAAQEKQMLDSGQSQEQVDKMINMSKGFMQPWMMGLIVVPTVIFSGFILSLIVSAVHKKEQPMFDAR
ncbi:DUF4199 domain-containing protein [Solitalea canadensis]|uniref:DUF4199 domain-containing protein n=1 Tax=Solitalea canadensis (strain ATCC 29591 / DSM 3403 / JCM 21819 / LMG 8368 / NBRC 15130 / NCIMB 12057 / USAM 9D) TaxID=929556 RepID=H8KV49_SOLCM|nr:DUF4199 domain-containing protein [Solitalea canadensis]AFD06049.1 hypothetical protein Solca_0934 [Solitalea canadensis DSM 3403]